LPFGTYSLNSWVLHRSSSTRIPRPSTAQSLHVRVQVVLRESVFFKAPGCCCVLSPWSPLVVGFFFWVGLGGFLGGGTARVDSCQNFSNLIPPVLREIWLGRGSSLVLPRSVPVLVSPTLVPTDLSGRLTGNVLISGLPLVPTPPFSILVGTLLAFRVFLKISAVPVPTLA